MTRDHALGKKLFVIVAHPDDESFIAAAAIRTNADEGGSTVLLCATKGERGVSHLPNPVSSTRLKAIRCRELQHACALLRVRKLVIMNLPDGEVERHLARFRKRAHAIARVFRPEVALSFGPDGFSGHHDHVAAYRVAYDVSRRFRIPLWCATLPRAITKRPLHWLIKRRSHNRYRKKILHDPPDHVIAVDPAFKRRVLAQHMSQFDRGVPLSGFPAYVAREMLKAEHFTVRRPSTRIPKPRR